MKGWQELSVMWKGSVECACRGERFNCSRLVYFLIFCVQIIGGDDDGGVWHRDARNHLDRDVEYVITCGCEEGLLGRDRAVSARARNATEVSFLIFDIFS